MGRFQMSSITYPKKKFKKKLIIIIIIIIIIIKSSWKFQEVLGASKLSKPQIVLGSFKQFSVASKGCWGSKKFSGFLISSRCCQRALALLLQSVLVKKVLFNKILE